MQARDDTDGSLILTHDSINVSRLLATLAVLILGIAAYDYVAGARGTERLVGLFAGAFVLLLTAVVALEQAHVVVNPVERTVVWKRRWGLQRRSGTLAFDDIDLVIPERPVGDTGVPSRRIVVRTTDGRTIPLTRGYVTDAGDVVLRSAERIAAMLGPAGSPRSAAGAMAAAGRSIDAIKHLRETEGLSLEEAKRRVDASRPRSSR